MTDGMRRGAKRFVAVAALGLSLCAVGGLAFAWSFAAFVDRIAATETPPVRHAEAAVALTGGADRIADAVDLLAKGYAGRLLITGVNPATTRGEIVRQTPAARSLIDCCIALGYEAENTVGNAAETERWVRANHIRSLIIVTSNYHMPRALAEMGSALPGVDLVAYPVVASEAQGRRWWSDGASARLILWEWAKYTAATVRIAMSATQPGANPTPEDATGSVTTPARS